MKAKHVKHKGKEHKELTQYMKYIEKQQKRACERFTERISAGLLFDDSVLADAPLTVLNGYHCVHIENYKQIIKYSDTEIILKTKAYDMLICGEQLTMEYFTKEELRIIGKISSVSYQQRGGLYV